MRSNNKLTTVSAVIKIENWDPSGTVCQSCELLPTESNFDKSKVCRLCLGDHSDRYGMFVKRLLTGFTCCALLGTHFSGKALACIGNTLTSQDQTLVEARFCECGVSRLIVSGRGRNVQTETAHDSGIRYDVKSDYVSVCTFKSAYSSRDNEKSLSAGLFFSATALVTKIIKRTNKTKTPPTWNSSVGFSPISVPSKK